ncbi:hypothetical protein RFZ45_04135, partial [Acinetobacter baumannii]|nr:hypothetical protein [Acinetobacter baumannii]
EDRNKINDYFIEYYGIEGKEKVEFENYLRFFNDKDIKRVLEEYMLDDKTTKDINGKTDGYVNVAVYNHFYDT